MSLAPVDFATVIDSIHGIEVSDPYRWLEDRNLPETVNWIRQQQKRCDAYFDQCDDLTTLRETVERALDVDVVDQPAKIGNLYFFRRRCRGMEQACIYVRDELAGVERLLVDPAPEGRYVSVGIHRIANDGSLLAYEVKHGGEDRAAIRIINVESGNVLDDQLGRGFMRGFFFTPDMRGFIYSQVASVDDVEWTIRLHRFGDRVPDEVLFRVDRSPRGRLSLLSDSVHIAAVYVSDRKAHLVADLFVARHEALEAWRHVSVEKTVPYAPWLQDGRLFVLSYDHDTCGTVRELDLEGRVLQTVVADESGSVRQFVGSGGQIYLNGASSTGFRTTRIDYDSDDKSIIELPEGGTTVILPQTGDGSSLFLSYESFTQPRMIFEYVAASRSLSVWNGSEAQSTSGSLEIRELLYPSKDGTNIPLTLVENVNSQSNTPRPLIMSSYGGFGMIATPQYSVFISILVEAGFVFAYPHIRGGGVFGKAWHDAGRGRNKQTTFDDFIAAAGWLIQEGFTTPKQLALFGGSNGGLLVGVAATQSPSLFKAVLCIAPLLDMVRYEYFDHAAKWSNEYGTSAILDDFRVLLGYSPYHAIRDEIDYPAMFFVTGDKDQRCNPAHVRKTAARLINRAAQRSSVLVDYSNERGHSPVLPLKVRVEALTRRLAFILHEIGEHSVRRSS